MCFDFLRTTLFMIGGLCAASFAQPMPIETKGQPSPWPWLTDNRYRVVIECQPSPVSGTHRFAWIELDFEKEHQSGRLPFASVHPDSVRVVEYDRDSRRPVKYQPGDGPEAYFVPAKIDEWPRYHQTPKLRRATRLSWMRRAGDRPDAVYICYFDGADGGERQRLSKPAYIGTGDALSFGTLDKTGYVRGTPIVADWNNDGKNDLLTTPFTVPERVTYLFLNSGDAFGDVFEKPVALPVSLGGGIKQVLDIDGDGTPDLLKKGGYYPDFIGNRFKKWVPLSLPLDSEIGAVIASARIVNWYLADWDGDGRKDVIIGADSWKDYGHWSDVNAYDSEGNWTNGPLRGWFYVFRNIGGNQAIVPDEPIQICTTDGKPAEVYGFPSPILVDLDNDGDLDLVSGDFLDRIWIFRNVGTRTAPRYAPPERLMTTEGEFTGESQAMELFAADGNNDGTIDIFFQGENNRVGYLENSGILNDRSMPIFAPVRYLRCKEDYPVSGQLVACDLYDWDRDGAVDLIFGDSAGFLGWYRALSAGPRLTFAEPELFTASGRPIRIEAGYNGSIQGPSEARWGYTVPDAGDWDGDDYADILLNSIWGKIVWCQNPGSHGAGRLHPPRPVEVSWEGAAPKPAWNWWTPGETEWATQWRSSIQMIDYDKDGLTDAAALDTEGYLVLHRRIRDGETLKLMPGVRLFYDEENHPFRLNADIAGRSGRRKFVLTDWDNDGDWDLIADRKEDGWNVILYLNTGDNARPILKRHRPLIDITLEGHSCSPAVFDLEGDGRLDLLVGAEDGHFYCFHRSYIEMPSKFEASFYAEN